MLDVDWFVDCPTWIRLPLYERWILAYTSRFKSDMSRMRVRPAALFKTIQDAVPSNSVFKVCGRRAFNFRFKSQ
jgi:hypothetical protein